jgi:hypothetical protein
MYLSRYYLIPSQRPTMADGSEPFDPWGNTIKGAIWPNKSWAIYLHHFHRSDVDRELHNHPWRWAVSLILVGGYREERRVGNRVTYRFLRPGMLNILTDKDFHRVDLVEKDAWSLFLTGPKIQGWGFWDRVTGRTTPRREFLREKQQVSA